MEAKVKRIGIGQTLIAYLETLLLGLWLGSMIFFSFVVAPRAFAVLPSRHLAGQLVSSSLSALEIIGLVLGPILIVLRLINGVRGSSFAKILHLSLLALMTMCAGVSRMILAPKLESLRSAMGGVIDTVSANDPLRLQFDDLHKYSVAMMTIAMLAGLIALLLSVRSWLNR
ncbi:MAG: hypothetical protein DMF61_18985 [Blastocatellia bacterium AA13]|nr:MAG: hypothetical protein DMF61_18985 [Blastocatellia bacterium AA13]